MKTENRNFGYIQMGFAYPHTAPIAVTQLEHDILISEKYNICHQCRDFYKEEVCPFCEVENYTSPLYEHELSVR